MGVREISAKSGVKIRKPHLCHVCLRKFPVRSEMDSLTYAEDARMYTLYICATCTELLRHIEPDCFNEYAEGCVLDEMSMYEEIETPEALLEYYSANKTGKEVT